VQGAETNCGIKGGGVLEDGDSCMVRSFVEHCWDCRVKENEMDGHVEGIEVMRLV
jgi:hypothetical protein